MGTFRSESAPDVAAFDTPDRSVLLYQGAFLVLEVKFHRKQVIDVEFWFLAELNFQAL